MSKAIQHFLFGFGSLLDVLPTQGTLKLGQFRSQEEDLQNISNDWKQVGHYLKTSMGKEREHQT